MGKEILENNTSNGVIRNQINNNFSDLFDALSLDRFSGKTMLVAGDSITESNFRASSNWHDYLKDWLNLGSVVNEARSGSGLIKVSNTTPNMVTRVDTWDNTVDYVAIMGNMNDGVYPTTNTGVPVGSLGDMYPSQETVYGAAAYIITTTINRMPLVPIVWISSTPRASTSDLGLDYGTDGWFIDYLNALKDVCNYYNVPFLDLYNESGLRPFNATHNATYFSSTPDPNGDGIHPNAAGQEIMARKILPFILQNL